MAQQRKKFGEKVAEHVFEPAVGGVVDAMVFGVTQALVMLWNRSRPENTRLAWALGEILIAGMVVANSKVGRFRDVALGVEAGGIAYALAPLVTGGTAKRVANSGVTYVVVRR